MRTKPVMSEDVYNFMKSLLDPEKFGHAVTAEVRDEARVLLGLGRSETEKYARKKSN